MILAYIVIGVFCVGAFAFVIGEEFGKIAAPGTEAPWWIALTAGVAAVGFAAAWPLFTVIYLVRAAGRALRR